jgi:photosystem II stability/assembly factor-like uncharacterized protein
MTSQLVPDVLDLAEDVARGRLTAAEAERQLRDSFGTTQGSGGERAVRELRELATAATAVIAHARATREATEGLVTEIAPRLPAASDARVSVVADLPVRGGRVRRRTRDGRSGRAHREWLLVAATLVAGGGVLGAMMVGGGFRPTNPVPASPVVANEAPTGPGSGSPSSSAPTLAEPAVVPGVRATAGMFGPSFGYRLVSDSVGWVSSATDLFRTADLGLTWRRVGPPGWTTTGRSALLDPNTAVLTSIGPAGTPARVAATHDGGVSWAINTFDRPVGAAWLTFRDGLHGDATFLGADTSTDVFVYATDDGGLTWTGPRTGTVAVTGSEFNKIQGGDSGVIWLSNGKADKVPFDDRLGLSVDGGATWTKTSFPIDATAPAGVLKGVLSAWADGSGHVLLAIDINGDTQAIYDSKDAGRTWRLAPSPSRMPVGGYAVHFLSATDWVLAPSNRSEIVSTVDAGAHWRRTPVTSSILPTAPSFGSIDNAFAERAVCVDPALTYRDFGYPRCNNTGVKEQLLGTRDGGATWSVVVP